MLTRNHGRAELVVVVQQSASCDNLLATQQNIKRTALCVVFCRGVDAERANVSRKVRDEEQVGRRAVRRVAACHVPTKGGLFLLAAPPLVMKSKRSREAYVKSCAKSVSIFR